MIDGVPNMAINANDLSYVVSTPFVKARLSGYLITSENEINVQRFYADGITLQTTNSTGNTETVSSAFVTQVMKGVSRQNMGVELGLDVKITSTLSL